MAQPVSGTDMVLYWHDPDTDLDVPIACCRNCAFTVTPSFKEVTDYQSAFFKKVIPDIAEWGMSAEGLVILDGFSYLHMTNYQKYRASMTFKFVVDNGSNGFVIYSGIVYIGAFTFTGTYNEIGTYSIQLIGTGEYSISGATITPGGIVIEGGTAIRYEYTVSTESTTITIAALIGASLVLTINRSTQNTPEIIYSGTPTGNQIKVILSTGTLQSAADNPFLATEIINGLYS